MPANFVSNPNCPANFLSGVGFQFQLLKYPQVAFYCQSANIPDMNLSVATQATRYNAVPQPGDEVNFGDLSVRFLVDENLKNYKSIHDWIRALGHPYSSTDLQTLGIGDDYEEKTYSDGILFVLDSNFNKKIKIVYKDLFPTSLSGLNFDSTNTDNNYFTAEASFKFTIFDIEYISPVVKPAVVVDPPTVTLSTNAKEILVDGQTFLLEYTSKNASKLTINNGVGEVKLSNGKIPIKVSDIKSLASNGILNYIITAKGKGGTATANVNILVGEVQTSANRVCIAVIDENSEHTVSNMETKWSLFRSAYPNRKFYLLQPSGCTSTELLNCPPSFLEETDPATITNPCVVAEYPFKYGHYTSTSEWAAETVGFNNSTPDTIANIDKYGVFRIGLEKACGNLSDIITLLNTGSNLQKITSYVNNGGVLWIAGEWVRFGCSNEANMNTILSIIGTTIRQNYDSATDGYMTRSNHPAVIAAGFPSGLYHNASAVFTGGIPIYQFAGVTTFAVEKMGSGLIVASGDINTYQDGQFLSKTPDYILRPPNELYDAFRKLVRNLG